MIVARRAAAILFNLLRDRPPGTVLMPASVCAAVPLAARRAGHEVGLVDLDLDTLALDADQCLDRVRARPDAFRAVVFVRPYGAAVDPGLLFRELRAAHEDLLLVDDRCLAPPATGSQRAPWADVSLWSTGERKHLDLGGGGFADLGPHLRYRPGHGRYDADEARTVEARCRADLAVQRRFDGDGGDGWLDLGAADRDWPEYRRAIAEQLPAVTAHKRALNDIYAATIPEEAQLPPTYQQWRFNVRVASPDALCATLVAAGLFAGRHYASLGGVFAGLEGDYPRARRLHGVIVNLFNDLYFDAPRAEAAAQIVRAHCERHGYAHLPAPSSQAPTA